MDETYDDAVLAVAQSWLRHKAKDSVLRTIVYLAAVDVLPIAIPFGTVIKVTIEFVPEDETRPC